MAQPTYSEMHIWRQTQPITLRVWDFGAETDVEIHLGHHTYSEYPSGDFVSTHTLQRSTHIIADLWDAIDAAASASA